MVAAARDHSPCNPEVAAALSAEASTCGTQLNQHLPVTWALKAEVSPHAMVFICTLIKNFACIDIKLLGSVLNIFFVAGILHVDHLVKGLGRRENAYKSFVGIVGG